MIALVYISFTESGKQLNPSWVQSTWKRERETERKTKKKNPHLVIKAKGCGQKRGII